MKTGFINASREYTLLIWHTEESTMNTRELSWVSKMLSVMLVLAILVAVSSIIYVVVAPKTGDRFTEFYMLGSDGKAENYPTDLDVGQQSQVIVGIINHEYKTVNYTIQVKTGDTVQSFIGPIVLTNEQKWERPVVFTFYAPHEDEQLNILLFRSGDMTPYRSLRLWLNVHSGPAISLSPSILAPATLGVPYKVTFEAIGGTEPYTFSEKGTLPRGVIFRGNTLVGKTSHAGRYHVIITAIDLNGLTSSNRYTLTILK
jgi:hypothetical protein